MSSFRHRAVAGYVATALFPALTLTACGSSAEDQAASYCNLLEDRNAALAEGDQEQVADILGKVARLLKDVQNGGDQREFTKAAQAKCGDLMEPTG